MRGISFVGTVLVCISTAASVAGCNGVRTPTETQEFAKAMDCPASGGWVALRRPNNLWSVGTVIEFGEDRAEDLGNVQSLGCFPADAWQTETGVAATSRYSGTWRYGVSLAAALGVSDTQLVSAGLTFGDPSGSGAPQHRTVFQVDHAVEDRVNFLVLEDYVARQYLSMSVGCKRVLTSPGRYLVDGVLKVAEGRFVVESNDGAKIDLSSPAFKQVADAAVNAGYQMSSTGEIAMSRDQPPMVVCARARRFDDVLRSIGESSKGSPSESFEASMRQAGLVAKEE